MRLATNDPRLTATLVGHAERAARWPTRIAQALERMHDDDSPLSAAGYDAIGSGSTGDPAGNAAVAGRRRHGEHARRRILDAIIRIDRDDRDIEAILTAWLDTPLGVATARADMWCENPAHNTPEPRKHNSRSRWCDYCGDIRTQHGGLLPDTGLLDFRARGIKLGKEAIARRLNPAPTRKRKSAGR